MFSSFSIGFQVLPVQKVHLKKVIDMEPENGPDWNPSVSPSEETTVSPSESQWT